MMSRTQITLAPEIQRQAKRRASDMGLSFAEYVRRLLMRDLAQGRKASNPTCVFDLGSSRESNIAKNKDRMIADAFADQRKKRGR